jgi:hypothetical protein
LIIYKNVSRKFESVNQIEEHLKFAGRVAIEKNIFSEIAGCAPHVDTGLIFYGNEIAPFDSMKNPVTRARNMM